VINLDPKILEALIPWKKEVDELALKQIGSTRVFLDPNCASQECSLGNLITDAMVDAVCKILQHRLLESRIEHIRSAIFYNFYN